MDWRSLPLELAATLAAGLRDDSRVKLAASGHKVDTETLILASAVDRLSTLVWFQTKDGEKGRNRPTSLVELLTASEKKKDTVVFASPEAFEAERTRILEQIKEGS